MNPNHHIHIPPHDFGFDASILVNSLHLVEYRSQTVVLILKFILGFLAGGLALTKRHIWDVPKHSGDL